MNLIAIFFLLVSSFIPNCMACKSSVKGGCHVSIKNLGNPQPLFLKPGTSNIWPYNATGHMEIITGKNLELFCPSIYTNPVGKSGSVIATCVSGNTFNIDGVSYDLVNVLCSASPAPSARKTGATCNGGIVIESGFEVGIRFVKQLEICFNEESEVTRYVFHKLQAGSNYYQSNVPRTNFKKAGFFGGKNVDNLYTQTTINKTFNNQLGPVAANYDLYLARGHIADMIDFVYGTEQRGTFLFLNTAPQWQVVNNGNWKRVGNNIRSWVSTNKLNINCYTGVFGISTLANTNGVQTPLYLDYDSNNNGLIPVPMLYFRVIIEPSSKRGVVLISINNPNLIVIPQDYILCPDVSDQITWLTWKKTDIKAGYSYACEIPEFAKRNPNLPKFDVRSLLK